MLEQPLQRSDEREADLLHDRGRSVTGVAATRRTSAPRSNPAGQTGTVTVSPVRSNHLMPRVKLPGY